MRAAGCLFTSSTLPGTQPFLNVLVENFSFYKQNLNLLKQDLGEQS